MTDNSAEQGTRWLSPEQLVEWKSLMGLLMIVPASLDAQLKQDAGLNLFEYHILVELAEAPERTRVMSELAGQTRGSLSRLSHAVSRLEAAGWVERRSCGGVGRRTEAILTAAGWRKLRQAAPGHVREARRLVIDALTAEQLENLGEAARRIVAVARPEIAATLTGSEPPCAEAS
jgi:DNA-binding MarR family transcriptional regulator